MDALVVVAPDSWKSGIALAKALQTADLKVLVLSCDKMLGNLERSEFLDQLPSQMASPACMFPGFELDSACPLEDPDSDDQDRGSSGWHAKCIHRETGQELYLVTRLLILVPSPTPQHDATLKRSGLSTLLSIKEPSLKKLRRGSGGFSWLVTACMSKPLVTEAGTEQGHRRLPLGLASMMRGTSILSPNLLSDVLQSSDGTPLLSLPVPLWRDMVPLGTRNLVVVTGSLTPSAVRSQRLNTEDIASPDTLLCIQAAWIVLFALGQIRLYASCSTSAHQLGQAPLGRQDSAGTRAFTWQHLAQMVKDVEDGSRQSSGCSSATGLLRASPSSRYLDQDFSQASAACWVSTLMKQVGAPEHHCAALLLLVNAARRTQGSDMKQRGPVCFSNPVSSSTAAAATAAAAVAEVLTGRPAARCSAMSLCSARSSASLSCRALGYASRGCASKALGCESDRLDYEFIQSLDVAPSVAARIKFASVKAGLSSLMEGMALGSAQLRGVASSAGCSRTSQESIPEKLPVLGPHQRMPWS